MCRLCMCACKFFLLNAMRKHSKLCVCVCVYIKSCLQWSSLSAPGSMQGYTHTHTHRWRSLLRSMCLDTYKYIRIYIYIHINTCMYVHTYAHLHIDTHTHTHINGKPLTHFFFCAASYVVQITYKHIVIQFACCSLCGLVYIQTFINIDTHTHNHLSGAIIFVLLNCF